MHKHHFPVVELLAELPAKTQVQILGLSKRDGALKLIGGCGNGSDKLAFAKILGAKETVGSATLLPSETGMHTVVAGLGDRVPTHEDIRRAVAAGVKQASSIPSDNGLELAISLGIVDEVALQAAVEGALMSLYDSPKLGEDTDNVGVKVQKISVIYPNLDAKTVAQKGEIIARAVAAARDWVNTPPNILYPESFAQSAQASLENTAVQVQILDDTELAQGGYGGILAVGGGSSRKPRLLRMSYQPEGADTHLALVGKGITFDSGGLDIKPASGMYTMKCDMAGGAAVIAAVKAIADLGLKVRVTAYVSMAENMPSGEAYRPSDVLTMYGGKTVENANTDAEGRLVMADAIARASEDKPDYIVDIATLTGACMVALGYRTAGLMTSDDDTAQLLLEASHIAGEPFWHLPITEDIRQGLKSEVADIRSSATTRYGGALTAGAFLQSFVADGIAWAHLDIAGPAFNEGSAHDYTPAGGTGSGVRTLVALAEMIAS